MAGKDRERRLARERYERNLAKRERTRERVRKRKVVIGVAAAIVIVVGGGSTAAATLGFPNSGGKTQHGQQGEHGKQGAGASAAASQGKCSYNRLPKSKRSDAGEFVGLPSTPPKTGARYTAKLDTNRGPIVIELENDAAPCTVNSFRFLAGEDFYGDTKCHRLVTDSIHVLQCGDPSGTGRGGPGYSFADENLDGATYPRGTVAMANSGPDTNGSQFFIVYKKGGLAPKYTPFGKVVKGMDIIDDVAEAGVAEDGAAPKKEVEISGVSMTKS